jgi:hypothetical protein
LQQTYLTRKSQQNNAEPKWHLLWYTYGNRKTNGKGDKKWQEQEQKDELT